MNVSGTTQQTRCLKAWQLISCRWSPDIVKLGVLLLTSIRPRFHPFGKENKDWFGYFPWICLSMAFGRVPGQVWLSFAFYTRCVSCALISFTLRSKLPNHHIYSEHLKEYLIVAYCFGDWGMLLIRWRLFLLFTAVLREDSTGTSRQLYVIINCFEMQQPWRPYSASQVV